LSARAAMAMIAGLRDCSCISLPLQPMID